MATGTVFISDGDKVVVRQNLLEALIRWETVQRYRGRYSSAQRPP